MHPQPLFEIGSLKVYPYGLCMAAGIILCFLFLLLTMKLKKFNEEATDKLLIIGVFGTGFGIFMALLVQSIYNYIANPSEGFKLEGMTFLGGLIGGVVSFLGVYFLYMYVIAPAAKRRAEKWANEKVEEGGKPRSKFLITVNKAMQNNMNATITDAMPFIPIGICIAHAFGRLGCFFGGCCYGQEADWGLYCAGSYNKFTGVYTVGPQVVPTQLFEMSFLIILAAVMAFLYFRYKFKYNFSVYAISYGIWRFIIEFFRDDDRGGIAGAALTPSQILSIFMVLAGVGLIFLQMYVLNKHMKHPELQNVEEKANEETCAKPTQGEN